ncbi:MULTISPECIES: M14 family metallopeptidase [Variovorax]|uniref:M14 family metallopeptidase n=1 Tax=Variovorax TaxID=34072 RepID=UPI000AF67A7C|nr:MULTISPECIES: M14 family metallocarboxypeptidase [Variovorax]MBN8756396.1 M14 family metallocarboxypeptidase [Variovorax sp.]UKI10294.1 M14 family metallocarboxypeptidase [Variovorax paradoxus]
MPSTPTFRFLCAFCGLALLSAGAAQAQFEPSKAWTEPAAVAARFPDPQASYATPGFRAGRTDFPSHAEVLAFIDDLARQSPNVRVERLGNSQQGRELPLVLLADQGRFDPMRPTVMVIGQQHGNEPAGGEAVLVLAQQFATGAGAALLQKINLVLVPRGNPDGAEHFTRVTANGIDVNRDHLLLRTPEARTLAAITLRYRPQVVLDLHEFTVGGRWIDKFGAVMKYDALLQPATVGNLDPGIAASAQRDYVDAIQAAFAQEGLRGFKYHTTSGGKSSDRTVSMGGVQPDTGRNVSGLRQSVSLLLEVRGVGLGRAHFARRVHTQVLAATTVIETAARQGQALMQLTAQAAQRARAEACHGDLVVEAWQTTTRQRLDFLDARSGEDKSVDVEWRAADPLKIANARPRPCGYLLAASESVAVQRLQMLGVRVERIDGVAPWQVERYEILSQSDGQRQDARGAIEDGEPIRSFRVRPRAGRAVVQAGSFYVSLAQPLSPLISAALEPDSQNSYAANRLLEIGDDKLLRVPGPPPAGVWH